jgi:hypothetical protein
MVHVLVLAEDECVRFTCAELLKRLGFDASVGSASGARCDRDLDVILMWEAPASDASAVQAAYSTVPVVVLTWKRDQAWPDGVSTVRSPFNPERVALELHRVARGAAPPSA